MSAPTHVRSRSRARLRLSVSRPGRVRGARRPGPARTGHGHAGPPRQGSAEATERPRPYGGRAARSDRAAAAGRPDEGLPGGRRRHEHRPSAPSVRPHADRERRQGLQRGGRPAPGGPAQAGPRRHDRRAPAVTARRMAPGVAPPAAQPHQRAARLLDGSRRSSTSCGKTPGTSSTPGGCSTSSPTRSCCSRRDRSTSTRTPTTSPSR